MRTPASPSAPFDGTPPEPVSTIDAEAAVDRVISRVGRDLVVALPLGLAKPAAFADALFERVRGESGLHLTLLTALTLMRPRASSELERRLVEPLVERVFAGYREPLYAEAQARGDLPTNVKLIEFYLPPGRWLGDARTQQNYVSANYTHAVRDAFDRGLNVFAQLVAPRPSSTPSDRRLSLSSNPDLTLDVLPRFEAARASGREVALLGEIHPDLPFFGGEAALEPERFDALIEVPRSEQVRLFGPPNEPVSDVDYAIGLHASVLLRDGGTLQLGIGSLGDAVSKLLCVRHGQNQAYRELVDAADIEAPWRASIDRMGGLGRFDRGLYASTEMLADGFLELYRCGVLQRSAYPDARLQAFVDQRSDERGRPIDEHLDSALLGDLVDAGVVPVRPTADDLPRLRAMGIARSDAFARPEGDETDPETDRRLETDLGFDLTRDADRRRFLEALGGDRLCGTVAHGGFFLGPCAFYEALRELPEVDRRRIAMTRISFVNELFDSGSLGSEHLKRLQRREARFVNSGLMATVLGAIVSDGFEDGRVLSGVGGQYNFVAMAHALESGRSILMIRATHGAGRAVQSNIRYAYGHTTIPRHLRDVVVTEYGIADLRGQTDAAVIAAMVQIADSRFQDSLVAEAKRYGKLPKDYTIPERFRANTPARVRSLLEPRRDLLPALPFGSDLQPEEIALARALRAVKSRLTRPRSLVGGLGSLGAAFRAPAAASPYLERMRLDAPRTLGERAMRATVLWGLALEELI